MDPWIPGTPKERRREEEITGLPQREFLRPLEGPGRPRGQAGVGGGLRGIAPRMEACWRGASGEPVLLRGGWLGTWAEQAGGMEESGGDRSMDTGEVATHKDRCVTCLGGRVDSPGLQTWAREGDALARMTSRVSAAVPEG